MTESSAGDGRPNSRGAERFAYHRQLSPLLWAFLVLALIETSVVHLLISHWSRLLAIVLFVLSATTILSLVALLLSFRSRPIELDEERLRVRIGFLVDAAIPVEEIAFVQGGFAPADYMPGRLLKASLLAFPNVVVLLRRDIEVAGPLGRARKVHAVALALDEPARFRASLDTRLKETEPVAA